MRGIVDVRFHHVVIDCIQARVETLVARSGNVDYHRIKLNSCKVQPNRTSSLGGPESPEAANEPIVNAIAA